jgi:putative transposase
MDLDVIVRKSKKIRIYPTKKQRFVFKQWLGTSRRFFNDAIKYLQTSGTSAAWKIIKGPQIASAPIWAEKMPYQIKSVAIRDACFAVIAAKRKGKQTGQWQKVHFKKKRDPIQSCYIPKGSITKVGIYPRLTGELKWSENLPKEFGDGRLVFENGRWFVCLPTKIRRKESDNQGRVVSLDPGVRTFLTYFSETGCGKLGIGDFGKIQRLCEHVDNLISRISKASHQQKQRFKKAAARMRWRIRDLVNELHHKSAKFLVENFDIILLPTFETKNMVKRVSRKIKSKTVRSMLTWAHYRFKIFLKHKAFEFGKTVIDVNESYTSKTVSWTGEIIEIGSRKKIQSKDGCIMDRDYNGARGIFLRALIELSTSFYSTESKRSTFPVALS